MKSKEEIKASLRQWMVGTIKATHKKAAEDGFGYHPSDISFAFRKNVGIQMNEAFILKALKSGNPVDKTSA